MDDDGFAQTNEHHLAIVTQVKSNDSAAFCGGISCEIVSISCDGCCRAGWIYTMVIKTCILLDINVKTLSIL